MFEKIIMNERAFNSIAFFCLIFLVIILIHFSGKVEMDYLAGSCMAVYGARNIVAFHLKIPFFWWYGNREDLKANACFQKQIYVSNYVMLLMGIGFIYF